MAKYLFEVSYTAEGAKGVLAEGGSKRMGAAEKLIASLGGSVEAMYFAFGSNDAYLIADLPDHESVTAASLTVAASGAAVSRTVVLLSAEQVDAAVKKSPSYRPPGS